MIDFFLLTNCFFKIIIIYFHYDRKWVFNMFCSNCGKQVSSEQSFCPNCGTKIQNNISVNNNVVSSVSSVNNTVNRPSDIGFNRNNEQDLNQFSFNNPYASINQPQVNVNSNQDNVPVGMNMSIGNKKKFPWIPIAIGLVIIMIVGIVFLPSINNMLFRTYENDEYSLKYNYNWSLDEEQDDLFLYYSDKFSKLVFNASTEFSDFSYKITDEQSKKELYKIFYGVWKETEGIKVNGGSDTFFDLENGSIYARVDYILSKDDGKGNKGSFYVLINEEYDSVISFMSYSTESKWETINEDIIEMLDSIVYKGETKAEKLDKEFSKFEPGITKKYSTIGYMDYNVPDSFTYDNERSANNQYKSNIFNFKDGYSIVDVKASTIYDTSTNMIGTSYEKMKESIVKAHGNLKEEDTMIFNGVTWYHMVTNDYISNGSDFHNEIYFTLSATGRHLYYVEVYIYNDGSTEKEKYINASVEYILNSMTLYKVEE